MYAAPRRVLSLGRLCLFSGILLALGTIATGVLAQPKKRDVIFGLPNVAMNSTYCMFPTATYMGFFDEEGLNVKVQPVGGGAAAVQTLLAGRLDFGGATPEPVFQPVLDGADVVLAYNFLRGPTGSIAVPADGPIKSIQDLRGKRLGALALSAGNIQLTNAVLVKHGIDPKTEMTYLAVGVGAQAYQALRSGHVDGLVLFDSAYALIETLGAKLRYFQDPSQERLFSTQVLVKKSVAESDPKMVEGFGRGLAKATLVAKENPEACVKMMWKLHPDTRTVGMAEADQLKIEVPIVKKRVENVLYNADLEKLGYGSYNIEDIKAWNDFAVETKLIPRPIENLNSLYTNRFVAAYNRFDREEIIKKARAWKE